VVVSRRSARESEVVHSFLHEVSSSRWSHQTEAALVAAGGTRRLVDVPNFADEEENRIRADALRRVRGWGTNEGMFSGFPTDVEWWRGSLEPPEVERLRYVDYSYWNALSGGSRRVADVARTLQERQLPGWLAEMGTDWCFELAEEYRRGLETPELIVLATPDLESLVVVEGHVRITGIVLSGVYRSRFPKAFIGTSAHASEWMP